MKMKMKMKSTQQIKIPKIDEESPNFPEELIEEILARLPVKSLLKFRSVCKSWLALISSPLFIKTHLKISSNHFPNQRIMFTTTPISRCYRLKHCSALSLLRGGLLTKTFDVNFQKKPNIANAWAMSYCNGLMCIAFNPRILYLWNPCTDISHRLPCISDVDLNRGSYRILGFGYCESIDDYRVLCIFCNPGDEAGVYELIVQLYSLRSNSWKRIEDFNVGIPLDVGNDSAKFVGGKIHVASSSSSKVDLGGCYKMDIVSIDLASEAYGVIEQPNYDNGVLDSPLALLGGCLSVLYNYKTYADVWVMKEYGVKESWTKVVTVPYYSNDIGKQLYTRPLCVLPNGVTLLVFNSRLVVYDPKDDCLKFDTCDLDQFRLVEFYVESLVSPILNARK